MLVPVPSVIIKSTLCRPKVNSNPRVHHAVLQIVLNAVILMTSKDEKIILSLRQKI